MEDVAEAAGVSVTTVSLVLNNVESARLSDDTRRRVLAAAKRLNYMPNSVARALARKQTLTIGLYIPFQGPIFFNHFLSQVAAGIQSVLQKAGYDMMLYSATGNKEGIPPNVVNGRRIDGLITVNTRYCTRERIANDISYLKECGLPFVVVNNFSGDPDVNYVGFDNKRNVYEAVSYLASLGHRRILFVGGFADAAVTKENLAGYVQALDDMQIEFDASLVVDGGYNELQTYQVVTNFLLRSGLPDAVFAASDEMAIGAMKALRERGYKIPDDVSVVGADDIILASYLDPPLTTIRVPSFNMGSMAAQILLGNLRDKGKPKQLVLESEFIIRRSCSRKRNV